MSRPLASAQRGLTLTEELERLEQQITLTLQEIDSNFSRAHRIVTSSILPVVEQYAEQSREVWEGSRFWKQFFESSANVSLSGYEEAPQDNGMPEEAFDEEPTENAERQPVEEDDPSLAVSHHEESIQQDEPDISGLSITPSRSSTPRPKAFSRMEDEDPATPMDMDYRSPYEKMRMELNETPSKAPSIGPMTPERPQTTAISATPLSSPFIPPNSTAKPSVKKEEHEFEDPVWHRVLDKTYRIGATPMGGARKQAAARSRFGAAPSASKPTSSRHAFLKSSPPSSPEPEAPKLNAELFDSPLKKAANSPPKRKSPVKPGISVLTPVKPSVRRGMWDSDEEEDESHAMQDAGLSPPKTMQFHVPQSRLMQTPAKEASRRIVTDLLTTAGGEADVTDENIQTPSMVRNTEYIDDLDF
ncbi:DASH complex subunit ask1 [Ascosphaera atra]|nr:DASH complex subunit ask1 [Ascosphaera atra]